MIGGDRRVGVDRASHKMPPLLFRLHRGLRLLFALFWLAPLVCLDAAEVIEADVCIYGGTAGGVAAAVQAARMGKIAVIAEFGNHLGGLTSGGLGATDIGNKAAIGGIAREARGFVLLKNRCSDPRNAIFSTFLACPLCKGDLTIEVFEENDKEIVTGKLCCKSCLECHPIEDGIPNMLPPDLRD